MAATPFGTANGTGNIPKEPPRITVKPLHAVRRNGSAYEDHHILAGDGPLQSAGKGSAGPATIPAVPPPTRHELAVDAGVEAGGLAGATAGAAAGKEAGEKAGVAAGEDVGVAIAENKTIPRSEVEAAAYKAGFEAGQAVGSKVTVASLVAKTVAKLVPTKTKPTLLGKAKKMSVVKKAVGTIKHHQAHPARKTTAAAAHDGKAAATGKRLGSRKTDKAADAKDEEETEKEKDEEEKEEEEKKKDAPLSEFLTKFSKLE